jgi:DNA repair protein RecO (recombination protein O)
MGFNTRAIVLHGMNYRETDRLLKLITEDRGKVSAIARGVKKEKSLLRGAVEPLTCAIFQLNPGRNLYTLSQADIIRSYHKIKDSLEKLVICSFFCELIDCFVEEGNPDTESYQLLSGILDFVEDNDPDLSKLVAYFEVHLHVINGIFPDFHRCVKCGSTETQARVKVDLDSGGAVCSACAGANQGQESYLLNSLFALDNASIKNLIEYLEDEYNEQELIHARRIISRFTSHYLGKELKSRALMETTLKALK